LLDAALVGGLGFAAGRASKGSAPEAQSAAPTSTDLTARLKELAEFHTSGALTDAEFTAAKSNLTGS
jgi:hypothetical protein